MAEWLTQPYFTLWQSIFLKSIALVYFWSFYCLHKEILGLVGSRGIYPIKMVLDAYREKLGEKPYYTMPTLFWLNSSDRFIKAVTWLGQILPFFILFDIFSPVFFFLLWVLYLSLINVSGMVMSSQYDILLIEVGFLSIFYSVLTPPPALLVYLAWFYLFRLMFCTGMYKVLFGMKEWRTLDALSFFLETQPFPTKIAYYIYKLPKFSLKILTFTVLFIQIVSPFFIFGPQGLRLTAGLLIALSQLGIMLCGNYAFFNVLTIALCIPLFMDVNPGILYSPWSTEPVTQYHEWLTPILSIIAILLFLKQLEEFYYTFFDNGKKHFLAPFRIANFYGMYSHLSVEHYEIKIEGGDGRFWRIYSYRQRAAVDKPLRWLSFLKFSRFESILSNAGNITYHHGGWFTQLIIRLLQGSSEVGALFKSNPFTETPPQFIRCNLEHFRFTDCKIKRQTGQWWCKKSLGSYCTTFYLADKIEAKKYKRNEPRPLVPFEKVKSPDSLKGY